MFAALFLISIKLNFLNNAVCVERVRRGRGIKYLLNRWKGIF